MQCYSELTPPTAVTHSLKIPFVSADSNNLLVARTSLLQVFSTKTISIELEGSREQDAARKETAYDQTVNDDDGLESSFLGTDSVLVKAEREQRTKLVLVAEYTLSGTVTSLARIKIAKSKSGGEALLVGFKDAKLSLVEWDPERHGLSTISIHYYEQDDLQGPPWAPRLADCVNYVTVDPGSRCAALKFGARNLAILPFNQGDDDVNMDDWDEELDGPRPDDRSLTRATNDESDKVDTPYGSSFVLRLSNLDSNLLHPVHISFLHEYREPTFGIISSSLSPSASLLHERKDHLTYMVFTLDLHQRASTTILSVSNLPYDLFKIVSVPAPIGGALLVGCNELIHIDQAGKANGVGVNVFAKQCTSFGLVDQSELDLRLESCMIEPLSMQNGEMLVLPHNGALAILSFQMDGRSVSGLSVRRVSSEGGGSLVPTGASSISSLAPNALFVGSESADAIVLGWSRKSNQLSRRKSKIVLGDGMDDNLLDDEDLEDDDADDDLYGDGHPVAPTITNGSSAPDSTNTENENYSFRVHDSLVNIAPIVDVAIGKSILGNSDDPDLEKVASGLELVTAVCKEKAGALAIIHQNVRPKTVGQFEFPEARGIWTMSAKRPTAKGLEANKQKTAMSGDYGADAEYDRLMIVSKSSDDDSESSDVYSLTSTGFVALTSTEFDPAAGSTVEAGTLGNGMRVIQVLTSEVRSYDGDLGLAQILPMYDDDTGAEPKIISASFADPFIFLLRDDSSIYVAQCDDNNEIEEIDREDDSLLATKWLTGCLYNDLAGVFTSTPSDRGSKDTDNVMMFLLSATGALYIYALPDLSKAVYIAEGLCFVPPIFSAEYAVRRSAARETLTEILVADLGDEVSKSPYLILRPANDDLIIYEPFRTTPMSSLTSLTSTLNFFKIFNPRLAENPEVAGLMESIHDPQDTADKPMHAISNLGGYSTVFVPGDSPSFIFKSAKTTPKVLRLQGTGVRGMSSFHTEGCNRGFIYADTDGVARVSQLPPDTSFAELGMSLQKIEIGQSLHAVAYHQPMECYVFGSSTKVDFELPKDDDHHRDWAKEDIPFKPTMEQGYLRLLNPTNWSIIDTIELEPFEIIMCVKTLNLEVSEVTNERKQLITVGTAISKGEDLAIKGRLYVYDVVSVVPEPDRPETDKKMKLIAKEEIPRGAVTGVSEIGTQGFMLVAQGQKSMVRGLKEDGTLLPVAFLDMNCYVTVVKELPGSGLCVLADAVKGAWLSGYTEEPYKMMLFGKSAKSMEIVAADLLPDGKQLFIVVADADCNLHIMQYDPEDPKSLQGHLLLHRSTFALGGHMATTMTLLPRTRSMEAASDTPEERDEAADATIPEHQILITSHTGSISLLSPLLEPQYRRLNTLANHLANALYHACGLNPRAYRTDKDAPEGVVSGRAIIDGVILTRWMELGSQRRAEVAGRVGMDVEDVRKDLKALMGGLRYL